jgi:hypothetical protein
VDRASSQADLVHLLGMDAGSRSAAPGVIGQLRRLL